MLHEGRAWETGRFGRLRRWRGERRWVLPSRMSPCVGKTALGGLAGAGRPLRANPLCVRTAGWYTCMRQGVAL